MAVLGCFCVGCTIGSFFSTKAPPGRPRLRGFWPQLERLWIQMSRVSPQDIPVLVKNEPSSTTRWVVPAEKLSGGETAIKWTKLSTEQKTKRVLSVILKLIFLFAIIFTFICTLNLLTDAFKLIGVRGLGQAIKTSALVKNPVSASILGMMSTLLLQNGSTLVSILVGMVASGLITVHQAIPFLIGSEIGASLTNALISLAQSDDQNKFRRSFAAASMNDAYNILNYLTLLPFEISFGFIERLSGMMVQPLVDVKAAELKTLNLLTDPFLEGIIDDDAINVAIAAFGENYSIPTGRDTFIYRCIDLDTKEIDTDCPYKHLFSYSLLPDSVIGSILLSVAIFALICCLVGIVQTLQSLLAGRVAVLTRKLLDKECPKPFQCLTGYLVMLIGCLIVMVVQSNTVLRSAMTPLVGIGVVTLDRLYPLLLGANIGSSFTGILAALSADPVKFKETLQIALCETLCNVFGVLIFYPIPFLRRLPMLIAMTLGDVTAQYKWFALVYIIFFFFVIPAFLLALSLVSTVAMISTLTSLIVAIILIATINWLQKHHRSSLPKFIQSWNFLPLCLRSLEKHFLSSPPEVIPNELLGTVMSTPHADELQENRATFLREIIRTPSRRIEPT